MKKVYIATSWKNAPYALMLATQLREKGYEVDCFCDDSTGRFVFSVEELNGMPIHKFNCINFLETAQAQKAFKEDKKWIDWCDTLIMLLPCGKSAHLEAGYAKGIGKRVVIVGAFPTGEFDVMYGFADVLIPLSHLNRLGDISNYLEE